MALVFATKAGSNTAAVTPTVDTVGSTLFVMVLANLTTTPTPTDSEGNTWVPLTELTGSSRAGRLFYVINPITSATHEFTGGDAFAGLVVAGWNNSAPSFDAENTSGGMTAGLTTDVGSIAPANATNLMVAGIFGDGYDGIGIDWGYTIAETQQYAPFTSFSASLAYLEQSSATTQNPTWTVGANNAVIGGASAAFVVNGGGGGGNPWHTLQQMRRRRSLRERVNWKHNGLIWTPAAA